MNRQWAGLLVIGAILMLARTTAARQTTAGAKDAGSSEIAGVPSAASQLKFLTEKLGLTGDQQEKIKPILAELHEATVSIVEDKDVSQDKQLEKVHALRLNADAKIRTILTEDQKKTLDQLEQEPHPELHGNLSGAILPQLVQKMLSA